MRLRYGLALPIGTTERDQSFSSPTPLARHHHSRLERALHPFGGRAAGHEKDVAVTIGYADDRTGDIVEADMIFNSKYGFAALTATTSGDDDETEKDKSGESSCKKRYDLQNVATHEAGHFFGLGEDMDDTKATMYLRSAACETHKRALTETDKVAMGGLYPAKAGLADQNGAVPGSGDEADANSVKAGCGARVAPVTSPRTDASFALLAVALAAVGRRFRNRKGAPTA